MGLLMVFPGHRPLAWDTRDKPEVVLEWILGFVPCYAGQLPAALTDEVIDKLLGERVPAGVIVDVIRMAQTKGYDFVETYRSQALAIRTNKVVMPDLSPSNVNAPRMGVAEPITFESAMREAKVFEEKFNDAQRAGNYTAMAGIVGNFRQWLIKVLAALMIGRQKPRHDQMMRMRAQIQLMAPNVNREADRLRLGEAPNPNELRIRRPPGGVRPPRRGR